MAILPIEKELTTLKEEHTIALETKRAEKQDPNWEPTERAGIMPEKLHIKLQKS